MALFFIGAVFTGAWHFFRRAQVIFSSSEVKIGVDLHATDEEFKAALKFVSDIEKAAISRTKHNEAKVA